MPFQTLSSFEEDLPSATMRRLDPPDLDAIFDAWQQTPNKFQFMTTLDLATAQALTERIVREPIDKGPKRVRRRSDIY
jgi:hypothetical protein